MRRSPLPASNGFSAIQFVRRIGSTSLPIRHGSNRSAFAPGLATSVRYQRAEPPLKLDGVAAARAFFGGCIAERDPTLECLWVAHLDAERNCLRLTDHPGDEAGTEFPLRSIIRDAAIHGSSAIILAHNHPSGDPTPSEADKRATSLLACAAEAIDCRLLDHLVFGRGRSTSFRELGLL
jgi:DNA repair protein RadC